MAVYGWSPEYEQCSLIRALYYHGGGGLVITYQDGYILTRCKQSHSSVTQVTAWSALGQCQCLNMYLSSYCLVCTGSVSVFGHVFIKLLPGLHWVSVSV